MPYDQVRTENYLRHPTSGALRDNTSGLITPQAARDEHVSGRDFARVKSHRFGTSSTTLTIDCNRGDVQEIQLNHSISTVNFTNRGRVNLIWPNTDLQHSNWSIMSSTTVTAGFAGPTGNLDAYRIQMGAGPNTSTRIAFDAIVGQPYTGMIWAKENGVGSGAALGFSSDIFALIEFGANISLTGSWARYQYTWAAANATATRYFQFDNQNNATVVDALIWRPQLYASDIFPDDQIFEDTLFDTTNAPSGDATVLTLILKQDSVGSRTIVWPANVLWASSLGSPNLSDTANAYDIITLITPDGGSRWFGAMGGQDFA